jgi:hypothetical protein
MEPSSVMIRLPGHSSRTILIGKLPQHFFRRMIVEVQIDGDSDQTSV